MTKSSKSQKKSFKEELIQHIDEYMDQAFATEDSEKRQMYRKAIHEMEQLLLTISSLE